LFRLDDRPDREQSVHREAARGEPGRRRGRGEARGAGGGAGGAASGSGGTRGASRFYRAVAGQDPRRGRETAGWRAAYGVHVMQGLPPLPPGLDPNYVIDQAMPLIAIAVIAVVGIVAIRVLSHTAIGEAWRSESGSARTAGSVG